MDMEAQRRKLDALSREAEAARKRTDEAAKLGFGDPKPPEKPDISRTTYMLGMIGVGLALFATMFVDGWYQSSLVKYPPDRPLISQEIAQCDEAKDKGWPQSPYCKYR